MSSINNIESIPIELILHIYNDLEKPADAICLASTNTKMLCVLKLVNENTFFKDMIVKKNLLHSFRFIPKHPGIIKLEGCKALWENNLYGKIFGLKSCSLTCLPPASIKVSNFKLTLATLCKFFSQWSVEEIEGSLRHGLRAKASNFLELRNELMKKPQEHPTYKAIKEGYTAFLSAKKAKIGVRLLELCRPNSNCERTAAFLRVNSAKEELKKAKILFINAITPEIDDEFACSLRNKHPHSLAAIDFKGYSDKVHAAQANLKEKSQELKAAEKAHASLEQEINSLTQSEVSINKQISNLDKKTMELFKQLAYFYGELSKEITPENLKQRSRELHRVMNLS